MTNAARTPPPTPASGRWHLLASAFLAWGALASPLAGQRLQVDSTTLVGGTDFRVYDARGVPTPLGVIVNAATGAEVLLLGEEHDDMVGHALQTALFDSVHARAVPTARGVVLSLEMFERDVQYVVDEYLADQISEAHFLSSARPWDDYARRYRPIVERAKAAELPVVAANAPRRYVNRVTREGPESLSELSAQARASLPPLPFPGPSEAYRAEWDALMTEAMGGADGAGGHGVPENAIHAQALWDAAMGHAVTEALVGHLGALVVHLAGSFHVANGTGIPERIADYRPSTRVVSVVMTKVDDVHSWDPEEHEGLGDYVILTLRPEPDAADEVGGQRPSGAASDLPLGPRTPER